MVASLPMLPSMVMGTAPQVAQRTPQGWSVLLLMLFTHTLLFGLFSKDFIGHLVPMRACFSWPMITVIVVLCGVLKPGSCRLSELLVLNLKCVEISTEIPGMSLCGRTLK